MVAGLQVFDAGGGVVIDTTRRVFRLLTVADIGTAVTGSVAVPSMSSGTVVAVPVRINTGYRRPTLTKTSTGLSWDYGSTPVGERDPNLRIAVGVY